MAAIEENAFTDVGDEAQRRRADEPDWSQPSTLRIGVDFNMEMDVVVDEVCAGEAEKFAEATLAAVVGTVEIELAVAGEAPASHSAFGALPSTMTSFWIWKGTWQKG